MYLYWLLLLNAYIILLKSTGKPHLTIQTVPNKSYYCLPVLFHQYLTNKDIYTHICSYAPIHVSL